MKNMLRIIILLAAVVAIVACTQVFAADAPAAPTPPPSARERAAAPAMGGQGMGGGGMRMGMGGFGAPMVWQLVNRLELDEATKTKVADLQKANMEKVQAGRIAMMNTMAKLNELPLTGGSEADIKATATELGKIYADQALLQAAALKDVKALLNAEQNTKLDEMIKESIAQAAARRNEMRGAAQGQGQETRREVRERAREGRPVPPPAPAPQN